MQYLVRLNCKYSTEVEASSVESAIAEANKTDCKDWDQLAWSVAEAEALGERDEAFALLLLHGWAPFESQHCSECHHETSQTLTAEGYKCDECENVTGLDIATDDSRSYGPRVERNGKA